MNRRRLTVVHSRYGAHKLVYFGALADAFDCRLITIFDDMPDDSMPRDLETRMHRESMSMEGVRVRHYNAARLVRLIRLVWRASAGSSGVITSTQNPVHSKVAWLVARLRGIPLMVVVEQWQDYPEQGFVKALYNRLSVALMRSADRCFVHGAFSRAFVERCGVRADAIRIFPHLNDDIGRGSAVPMPAVNDGLRLLYVGRYVEVKGLDILLDAFEELLDANPDSRLRLYGDGPLRDELVARCRERLSGSVEVLDRVAPSELRNIMSWCHALVLPSRQLPFAYEGWGLVVGEAASVGRVLVVSSVVGSGPELVHEGLNGFIVQEGSVPALACALRSLAKQPDRLSVMGAASRRLYEEYSNVTVCVRLVEEAMT